MAIFNSYVKLPEGTAYVLHEHAQDAQSGLESHLRRRVEQLQSEEFIWTARCCHSASRK